MKTYLNLIFCLLIALFISKPIAAQLPVSLTLPQVSPFEERSITIGFTEIKLEYSSVGIKGREIWDGLIPYGEVWRAGANKNTIFSVSDDVLINGQPLPAGSYGFHTIPGEKVWTIIFSNNSEAWGSYFYDETEDALRITVDSQEMDSKYEWMKFSFSEYTDTSLNISLKWAHRSVPFDVTIPREVTFTHIEKQFTSLPAFSWQGWMQGAEYTLSNNYEIEKGLEWANRAVGREENVRTLNMLARLQLINGMTSETMSTIDNLITKFGDQWRAHVFAGEVHALANHSEAAISSYEKAISMIDNERFIQQLQQRIQALK